MVSRRRIGSVAGLLLWGLLAGGLFAPCSLWAQSGARSVEAIGTGGGAAPTGASTSALYTNPAHLQAGPDDPVVELRLFDVRAYAGGDLLQFDHYERAFGDASDDRTDAEETAILDAWFGSERRNVATYVEGMPLAIAVRPSGKQWALGFGVRTRALAEVRTDRGLFDLFLVGADSNRTVPVNGRVRGFSTVDFTGTFSYTFDAVPLSVGVSPRLILGTGFADGRLDSELRVTDDAVTYRFDYRTRAAGGASTGLFDTFDAFSGRPLQGTAEDGFGREIVGIGVGGDLGLTYEARPGVFVSMSVTDLGRIQWNTDPQTVTPTSNEFRFDGVELNVDRLQNEFDGDLADYYKQQVDSLARAAFEDVDRQRSSFSTDLPTAVHVSSTWNQGILTLNGGATLGIKTRAGAVHSSPAGHLGGELRLGPIPIRAGVRVGGPQALTFSGGIGLDVGAYRFDVGLSATPNTSTLGGGGRYAVGLSLATIQF